MIPTMTVIELPDLSSTRARVAAEVRAELARLDVPQSRLAEATGITAATLSRRLKAREERDSFTVDELGKIAAVLRVPITKFFRSVDDNRPDDDPRGSSPRPGLPLPDGAARGNRTPDLFITSLTKRAKTSPSPFVPHAVPPFHDEPDRIAA